MEMNAKQLAEKAGISASYLSEVENGESAISSEKLLKIARTLRVTMRFLLEGGDEEEQLVKAEIRIPAALSELAEELNLSYSQTFRLLLGRQSLIARRSSNSQQEWGREDWRRFYLHVKEIMER
jgi:transcriptional regulator with XRE-family HTH domain